MSSGASGLPPERIEPIADLYDEVRYGRSFSGNVPAGGRDITRTGRVCLGFRRAWTG